jgi:hypothetical protein
MARLYDTVEEAQFVGDRDESEWIFSNFRLANDSLAGED